MSDQDEIAQILSEIEGIQADIEAKAAEGRRPAPELKLVEPAQDLLEEFRAAAGGGEAEGGLEETLGDLKDAPESAPAGGIFGEMNEKTGASNESDASASGVSSASTEQRTDHESVGELISMADHTGDDSTGELSMTISGSMKLNLRYAADGQDVAISFDNGTLCVELADGTEFRVPMNRASGQSNVKKTA